LVIRYQLLQTLAIDKVTAIDCHNIKTRRVLGRLDDVPTFKGNVIQINVFWYDRKPRQRKMRNAQEIHDEMVRTSGIIPK